MTTREAFNLLRREDEWRNFDPLGDRSLRHVVHKSGIWFFSGLRAVRLRNEKNDVVYDQSVFNSFLLAPIAAWLDWRKGNGIWSLFYTIVLDGALILFTGTFIVLLAVKFLSRLLT